MEAEYKALHIELWQWLYDHPDKDCHVWPGWEDCDEVPGSYCLACQFAFEQEERDDEIHFVCDYCPLDQGIMKMCQGQGTFYDWCEARYIGDSKAAQKYAAMIRDAWREVE
jgi:hypothetical protein